MSDKLCPMRKETKCLTPWIDGTECVEIQSQAKPSYENFLPCLGEKCAWWEKENQACCLTYLASIDWHLRGR